MAILLQTNPPTVPTISPDHWTQFVDLHKVTMKGKEFPAATFCVTNWDTGTAKPLICGGSVFEVGGSYYVADSDTALTDEAGLADGQVRIKLVPNGGGTAVVPTLTSDPLPAWSSTKYGWYDADDKFLPLEMTRSGAITKVFSNKFEYTEKYAINKLFADGGQYIGGSTEINGSLAVGDGATFGGAVSGITSLTVGGAVSGVTNLTASGNISAVDITASGDITCNKLTTGNGFVKFKVLSGTLASGTQSVDIPHGLNTATQTVLSVTAFKSVLNAVPNFPNTPKGISLSSSVFRCDFSNDTAPITNIPVQLIVYYI